MHRQLSDESAPKEDQGCSRQKVEDVPGEEASAATSTSTGFTFYEINTRVWCQEFEIESGASGGLDAVPDRVLDAIAGQGFDAVWLMGVWTANEMGRYIAQQYEGAREQYSETLPDWQMSDVLGSPFAIRDYTVAESLGSDAALERMRARLAARGMGLILDFVPNHMARDHRWVGEHPDWFVHGTEQDRTERPSDFFRSGPSGPVLAHGRDPHFPGWIDTAQLDYRNPEVRRRMSQILASVARRCDGLRCDMTILVLSEIFDRTWKEFPCRVPPAAGEFWSEAIDRVRADVPDFKFIAEAYWGLEGRMIELGFDYAYDKGLYDVLHWRKFDVLQSVIGQDQKSLQSGVRFLENHDEPRAAAVFPAETYQACAAVTLTLPGARLVHEGQVEGAKVRLPVQLARRPEEPRDRALYEFYRRFLPVVTSDTLRYGQWRRLEPRPAAGSGDSFPPALCAVYAWQWSRNGGEVVVCVANFAEHVVSFHLPLQVSSSAGSTRWTDVVTGKDYLFDETEFGASGMPVKLNAFQAKVLVRQ
jgi:hypothetical protein